MTPMPKPTGLFETHLTVSDLDRSIAFYRDVVGLPLALRLDDRGAAFFWVGGPGKAMLGLWSLGSAPMGLSLHIALEVSLKDVLSACDALRSGGVTPLSFFGAETTEPSVIGWMPAAAVYFRDPDAHLIEYLAMMDEPAHSERGIVPWSTWVSGADAKTVRADAETLRADAKTLRADAKTLRAHAETVRVERHAGPRGALRALFEEAEDSASALDAYIDAGEVLVAVANDDVVGHLQILDAGAGTSEINNMAVTEAFRGRGIGRRLIETAIDVARERGHHTLAVATAAADVGNLRFYQRAGFRMRAIERDAFTPSVGYPAEITIDGIRLRDRVWLDLDLDTPRA